MKATTLATLLAVSVVYGIAAYGMNLYKFTQCNFKDENLTCEMLHGVGLVTPVYLVGAWINVEDGDANTK